MKLLFVVILILTVVGSMVLYDYIEKRIEKNRKKRLEETKSTIDELKNSQVELEKLKKQVIKK